MLYSFTISLRDSLAIKGDVLLGSELVLGTSYLDIFRPLLVIVWVLARALKETNGVCTAWDLVYGAVGA